MKPPSSDPIVTLDAVHVNWRTGDESGVEIIPIGKAVGVKGLNDLMKTKVGRFVRELAERSGENVVFWVAGEFSTPNGKLFRTLVRRTVVRV